MRSIFLAGVGAVLVALSVSGATAANAAGSGSDQTLVHVAVVSDLPYAEGQHFNSGQLPASVKSALTQRTSAGASPSTSTPNGYKVRGGRVTDTRRTTYVSDNEYAMEFQCDSDGCDVLQQVRITFKETLVGGSSNVWKITFFSQLQSGPSDYTFRGGYGCGDDIKGGNDQICAETSIGAHGGWGPYVLARNDSVDEFFNFGGTKGIKLFPYVHMYVTMADGTETQDEGSDGFKFRGWDVCTSSNNQLCATATSSG